MCAAALAAGIFERRISGEECFNLGLYDPGTVLALSGAPTRLNALLLQEKANKVEEKGN